MSIKQQIINVTKKLILIPTLSSDLKANREGLKWIANYLTDSKLSIKSIVYQNVPSLIIKAKKTQVVDVILHGHLDVVVGSKNQFQSFLKGDQLYGRGSLDMKGALAVMMVLTKKYLSKTNHALLITCDEEIGGKNGCGYLTQSNQISCNYFLTGEPTNLAVADEEKGVIWFGIKIKGSSTHASTPWAGENTLLNLCSLLNKISKLYPTVQKEDWVTTVSPTKIEMSNSQNQIPGELIIRFDCRYIPSDNPDKILAVLSKVSGCLEVQVIQPPLGKINHPYTKILHELTRKEITKMHFASDARFFYQKGIPSIIFGPSGANIHGDNEWVSVSSLMKYYKILENLILITKDQE